MSPPIAHRACAAMACVLFALSTAPESVAQEAPTTVAGLLTYYYDLGRRAEAVNEQLLKAEEDLAAHRRDAALAAEEARAAADRWDRASRDATSAAAEQRFVVLLDAVRDNGIRFADGELAAERASLAGAVADTVRAGISATLATADAARRTAQAGSDAAAAATAKSAATAAEVTARRAELGRRIDEVRAALDALPADQVSLLRTRVVAPEVVVGQDIAGRAVAFALAQLGKPYEWGGVGPDAFDCSGLVQAAYRSAGVVLPRVAADQARVGVPVARADVRAGDLVFFHEPVTHVAMAIDGTRAVHAATFGQPVKVSPIDGIGRITAIKRNTSG
ncbi:C40 family peptidase [Lentzea sp. NPDC059081]|uniref:C40 family peptidase n=1 Tax=Lentzea sp. NPDC059081 TaxID=3346719 RepID=UPI00368F28B8